MCSRYFQAEGLPEQVVDLLSTNYQAMAQTANLLAEWLILAGKSLHSTILPSRIDFLAVIYDCGCRCRYPRTSTDCGKSFERHDSKTFWYEESWCHIYWWWSELSSVLLTAYSLSFSIYLIIHCLDTRMAAEDDRIPHLEEFILQTGRGIPRLSYVELHHKGI